MINIHLLSLLCNKNLLYPKFFFNFNGYFLELGKYPRSIVIFDDGSVRDNRVRDNRAHTSWDYGKFLNEFEILKRILRNKKYWKANS